MHVDPVGNLVEHEMTGKRQEDAEAEDLERMLAAQDGGPQPGRFQARPIAADKPDRDGRH